MDFLDTIFGPAVGIMKIFEYGIEPIENEIIELTAEQYTQLRAKESVDMSLKWYVWLTASDPENSNELCIMNELEMKILFEAKASIDRYATRSNLLFENYDQKLHHVAKMYPPIFSERTQYKPFDKQEEN